MTNRPDPFLARRLFSTTTQDTRDWIIGQYLTLMAEMDECRGEPKNMDPLTDLWHEDVVRRMQVAGINPDAYETWNDGTSERFIARLAGESDDGTDAD